MFKRLLIMVMACSLCSYSFAYQLLDNEETIRQQTQIAASLVENAKQDFLAKIQDCLNLSKKETLLPTDFSNIQLNEKELKTIILYFSAKTMKECVGDKSDKYLTAEMVARKFNVSGYSKEDDQYADKILATGASLSTTYIRYTPDYLAIDVSKRKQLEKISKLNTVFDLDASINTLLKK